MALTDEEVDDLDLDDVAGTRLLSACDYVQKELLEGARKVVLAARCPICGEPTQVLSRRGFGFKCVCPNNHIIRVDEAWMVN